MADRAAVCAVTLAAGGARDPAASTASIASFSEPATNLVDLLHLEELDVDLYRGRNEPESDWAALFGGQVAAQALMAAAHTVPAGRDPHSLHGYFLRRGRHEHPVILEVARERDGRSFSSRHVVARQRGQVIFSMSTSFHRHESGPELIYEAQRAAPQPEDVAEVVVMERFRPTLRFRPLTPTVMRDDGPGFPARMWVRTTDDLPDDDLIHACALTYLSDVGSGFAEVDVPGLPPGGPSLDHALWFQRPLRADSWLLLELWPLKAGGGRGLYAGSIRDRSGRVGAMLTQEVLLRAQSIPNP